MSGEESSVGMLKFFRFVLKHPFGQQHPLTAFGRIARWQLSSLVGFGPSVVPFVEDGHLIVGRGMTGATGNVYVGLHEFDDMAFVLHALRPGDLFADIGANIGAYTILAAKAVGANCISVEPLPATFAHLENNVYYNRVGHLVEARNVGLAANVGKLRFSTNLDTRNHVVDDAYTGPAHDVDVLSLDELLNGRVPLAMKIDVEGFELEVLSGAMKTLVSKGLQAIVIEVNNERDRYDQSGKSAFDILHDAGFGQFKYDPRERRLSAYHTDSLDGNYLFIRELDFVAQRVATSRRYRVGPWSV